MTYDHLDQNWTTWTRNGPKYTKIYPNLRKLTEHKKKSGKPLFTRFSAIF